MTTAAGEPTPSEAVLMRFGKDLETAEDLAAARDVFARYAADHPYLRGDLDLMLQVRLAGMADAAPATRAVRPGGPRADGHLLRPGDQLDVFRVVRFVAKGGMGEVYEAWQDHLDRRVALKVAARPFAGQDVLERQFACEQQVPAQLHQTHVVPIHFAGHADVRGVRVWYYVMHFVDGVPLSAALTAAYTRETSRPAARSTPPLTELVAALVPAEGDAVEVATQTYAATGGPAGEPSRAARAASAERLALSMPYFVSVAKTMREIGEAVGYLHARGVRHRDVKPSNVMMDRTGASYLIDFGLAARDEAAPESGHSVTGHPESSHGVTGPHPADAPSVRMPLEPGTPEYMAPEQFAGPGRPPGPIDPRADVYALGATLYELLTLRPAFRDRDRVKVMERVAAGDALPVRALVTNVPRDLAAVCRKAMAVDPAARYATAAEFAAELGRWCDWRPTAARPGWETLRPLRLWAWRKKATAAAVLLFVLLLGGSTAWAIELADRREAELRRQKEELEQVEKDRQYQQTVLDATQVRLGPQYSGWSGKALAKLAAARDIRPEADLRDHVAATFVGPDARIVVHYELPRRAGTVVGLGDLAYSPDGRRLLAGGWMAPGVGTVHLSPARLWDENAARGPVVSTAAGAGPVAFADNDTPLQLLLPAGDRRNLVLWNVAADAKVAEVPPPDRPADDISAALSADARLAAVTFGNGPAPIGLLAGATQLWALDPKKPGAAPRKLGEWATHATALAFAPDGKYLATGTGYGEVVVRSTADGAELLRVAEAGPAVTAVAFGRNFWKGAGDRPRLVPGGLSGWLLAVATKGGGLGVWDLETRRRVNSFPGSHEEAHVLAFSPDGTTLASAGRQHPFLWDVATGRQLLQLTRESSTYLWNWMAGLAFTPDGRRLAVSSPEVFGDLGGLDVFELSDGRGVRTLRGPSGQVQNVIVSPARRWVAALAQNWQLAVWDWATGHLKFVWDVPPGWTPDNTAVAFDERAGEILFASGTRATRWSLATGERTGSWELPLCLNDCLAVPPGGRPLLVRRDFLDPVGADKPTPRSVILGRELGENGAMTEVFRIPRDDLPAHLHGRFFTTDGRYLLINGQDRAGTYRPYLYDGRTGKPIPLPKAAPYAEATDGSVSPAGTFLLLMRRERSTHVLRLPDMTPHGTHPATNGPHIDDAGTLAAYTVGRNPGTTVCLARLGEREPILTIDAGRGLVGWVQGLTPDGRYLVWGREDGAVCIADVNRCLEQLAAFGGPR